MQFYVTQNHGTEPPFTGRLLHNKRDGVYHCLVCDAPLFNSQTKYDSGCGWPSFYEPVSDEAIRYLMTRRTACSALKFAAETAMRTWGMSSRMVHSQRASVSASIRPH
jgi:methionine-R-sulfoxide reductase